MSNYLNREFIFRIFIFICSVALIIAASESAFAADENDVIGKTLCRVTENLSGPIAKSIATIAIFVIGVMLFMGKVNWGTAAATARGFNNEDFKTVGNMIVSIIDSLLLEDSKIKEISTQTKKEVVDLCSRYPIYAKAF